MVDATRQFYAPFSFSLYKAEENGDKWNIYLQASNEGLDQQEEVLLCKALQDAKDYYLQNGVLSWDHQHKITHDPKFIIGEPTDVAFSANNETLVKGFLYKENEIAQSVWKNIVSGAKKLGASVGGGILKKAKDSTAKILQVIWDETAVTHKPVNSGTMGNISVIPFTEFAKALMAGSGVNAANFTGGRALTSESLQGYSSDILGNADIPIDYGRLRQIWDGLLSAVSSGSIDSYNDIIQYILSQGLSTEDSKVLINFITEKIPALAGPIS